MPNFDYRSEEVPYMAKFTGFLDADPTMRSLDESNLVNPLAYELISNVRCIMFRIFDLTTETYVVFPRPEGGGHYWITCLYVRETDYEGVVEWSAAGTFLGPDQLTLVEDLPDFFPDPLRTFLVEITLAVAEHDRRS